MHGLMMDTPLLMPSLARHAATYHGDGEVVSRSVEGPMHRYAYADAWRRMQRLANALVALGVGRDDRVGTLAWNGYRHLELYFAVPGIGAVCHTINPRLFHDQIRYIVNHAEDRFVFLDLDFVKLVEALHDELKSVEGYVVMTDRAHMPETSLPNALCYEELLAAADDGFDWPLLDENQAAAMCYSSGTTGNPKGVLYSHRAIVLHTFSACTVEHAHSLASWDTVMPVVPMFHVHAWGIPYAAVMSGCKLVLPGPKLDGESLCRLLEDEQVTMTAGVPTVWLGVLDHLARTGKKLTSLERILIGGAAAPPAMIEAFERDHGVEVIHAWGMTETTPVCTTGKLKRKFRGLPPDRQRAIKRKQGRPIYGVEMKIVDDDGTELPHDGKAMGQLWVRGPWIASAYYRDADATEAAFADGWFATGDVVTIDADGHIYIADRAKDLIKSGGEWISSIDLENAAVGHPDVAEAAVIAAEHPKWGERPLLIVVPREGAAADAAALLAYLADKVARWWLPDDVVFVDELPHTATGKISKRTLRERFAGHKLPTV